MPVVFVFVRVQIFQSGRRAKSGQCSSYLQWQVCCAVLTMNIRLIIVGLVSVFKADVIVWKCVCGTGNASCIFTGALQCIPVETVGGCLYPANSM